MNTQSTINSDRSGELRSRTKHALSEEQLREILSELDMVSSSAPVGDPEADECYAVFSRGNGYLVKVKSPAVDDGMVRLELWHDGKSLSPIPLAKWQSSIARSRILRLNFHDEAKAAQEKSSNTTGQATGPSTPNAIENSEKKSDEKPISDTAERDQILDMGAFTQLLDAAQRSGIVPGLNNIVQVRDCEFRLGKYNKALQMMETMFSAFLAAQSQRNQRLQREYAEISSGRKKMSPKELQAKRVQDNHATQAIDRAQTRFQRVLEGLRGVIHLEEHGRDSVET